MFKYIKFLLLPITCLLLACNATNNKPLVIQFSADSSKILFVNIDPAGLSHLKSNLLKDSAYQKLVSVLQTPINDDSTSMEMEWPGKLTLLEDTLVFTPDTAFRKGKAYLVETMLNAQFASRKDVVRSEVGHQLKPQQKMMLR